MYKMYGKYWRDSEAGRKVIDDVETVSIFAYLDDCVSACGGSEAAVTAGTRCGWVKFRECGELLYGTRFPLKLKGEKRI